MTAGYNWQRNSLVLGVEADLDYADLGGGNTRGPFVVPGSIATQTYIESVRSNSLFTLRPRVGLAVDQALFFVTGGLAVGNVEYASALVFPKVTYSGSTSQVRAGWALGAGVEYALSRSWSTKAEYLHVDLGKVNFVDQTGLPSALNHSADISADIVRVGLNYRF